LRRVHADVAGAVELRTDLTDLRDHEFVVVDEGILAEGTTSGRARDDELPAAGAERGRLAVVVLADREHLVLLDGGQRLRNDGGIVSVVGRAGAVIRAPFRRRPILGQRLLRDRALYGLRPGGV